MKARPISCVEKNENTWLKVKISLLEPEMKISLPEPEIAYLDGSKRMFSDSLESSSAHSQDESSKEQHLNESKFLLGNTQLLWPKPWQDLSHTSSTIGSKSFYDTKSDDSGNGAESKELAWVKATPGSNNLSD